MADQINTFSSLSNDAVNAWLAEELLGLSERQLVIGQYAKKYTLPERNSMTMRVVRYKRLSNPRAPLSEGVTPETVAGETEHVNVTVEQWGLVAAMTDIAEITTKHPALTLMIERVSRAMSETLEREMAKVLLGGTNVEYAGAASARSGLTGAVYLTTGDIQAVVSLLRSNGAMDYEGGLYVGCMSPQVEQDMMGDTTFANAASYSQVVRLNVGEIGIWGGVRWVRSNFLPIYKGVGAPGTQSASVSGYTAGSGSGLGAGTLITVVSKDIQSGYERKISAAKTADDDSSVTITTPTSTSYVYDIYQSDTDGTDYKLVFENVAANTAKTIDAASYTAGLAQDPPAVPNGTNEVFVSWVFGKEAFGRVDLSGASLESFLTPKQASDSDPLAQRRKIGAKLTWKSFILDNNYFARLESNSRYSANLPA